uniref:Epsin-2 n=1 Tax=Phallusia mammillata TaxID=59560 RepID=A0A6F9DCM7_9ASCI|nr:epsin-2 [Phallusia mammillata]
MNVVRNYSDAEIKVREATSNDPWGPSSSLMSEIADMTYNVVAFSEIMTMIWKRINDHGKNWRHVYKALVLLDYLIKTGSERVAQQCKENIFAIQTLKDFQFIDRDVKDQGSNVREKSKQLVNLLKDEERLKTERVRALKAKERFAQATTGIGSDRQVVYGHGGSTPKQRTPEPNLRSDAASDAVSPEIEQARPQTAGEEELQLQLALSMSKEEAESEKKKYDSDNVRLEMAIQESVKNSDQEGNKSNLVDLTAAAQSLKDPWGGTGSPGKSKSNVPDPFSSLDQQPTADQWGTSSKSQASDPWGETSSAPAKDPWSVSQQQPATTQAAFDPFSSLEATSASTNQGNSLDILQTNPPQSSNAQPFDFSSVSSAIGNDISQPTSSLDGNTKPKKSAEDFLGGASDLVNLDSLVTRPTTQQPASNPFLSSSPYHQPTQNQMTLNQMKGVSANAGPALGTTILHPSPNMQTQPAMVAPIMQPPVGMPPAYGNFQPGVQPTGLYPMGIPPGSQAMMGMPASGVGMMGNANMNPNLGMHGMGTSNTQQNSNPFL